MEWIYWIFIAFSVLSLISISFTAYRYRKYIQTGWFMLKAYRQFKQKTKPKQNIIDEKPLPVNSPMIKCAKCQKWFPQSEGVKLKNSFFCSHKCLEQAFTSRK